MAEIIIESWIAEAHGVPCASWLRLNTETGVAISVQDKDRFGISEGEPMQLAPETCIAMMQEMQERHAAETARIAAARERKAAFLAATCPNCGMSNFDCGGGCHE